MPVPAVELQVGERTVRVTSPDKVYFPDVGVTKLDMVQYVIDVGDGIFAALRDRPVTLERWPGGDGADHLSLRADGRRGMRDRTGHRGLDGQPGHPAVPPLAEPAARHRDG